MNSITSLTPKQLRKAADIKERIDALQDELNGILGSEAPTPQEAEAPKKRKMSAAGRRAIAAAAKARWAKYNAGKGKPARKAKRMFSAAGRAAIAAATRARWAKAKAAGKSRL
jgi:hypothetical protein